MPWFIKPPFFQWPEKPAASRGLGDQAPPIPPPATAIVYGGPATLGASESRGDIEITLPPSYAPGSPVQVLLDCEWLSPDAANKVGVFIATINGGPIAAAAFGPTGFGPVPGQDMVLYVPQRQDPTTLTYAQLVAPGNIWNVAYAADPAAGNRHTVTLTVPGVNIDNGATSTLDFLNWGSQVTPNKGHNINGGSSNLDGAGVQAVASAVFPPGTFTPGQAYTPTLSTTPGLYGFIQCLAVAELMADGSGAAGLPGFPALSAIPAGTRQLQPGDTVSVCIVSHQAANVGFELYGITVRAGGVDQVLALPDIWQIDLFDQTAGPVRKIDFGQPPGANRWYYRGQDKHLITEDGNYLASEAGIGLIGEPLP